MTPRRPNIGKENVAKKRGTKEKLVCVSRAFVALAAELHISMQLLHYIIARPAEFRRICKASTQSVSF